MKTDSWQSDSSVPALPAVMTQERIKDREISQSDACKDRRQLEPNDFMCSKTKIHILQPSSPHFLINLMTE